MKPREYAKYSFAGFVPPFRGANAVITAIVCLAVYCIHQCSENNDKQKALAEQVDRMMAAHSRFVDAVCICKEQKCVRVASETYGQTDAETLKNLDAEAVKTWRENPKTIELTNKMNDCAFKMATTAANPAAAHPAAQVGSASP